MIKARYIATLFFAAASLVSCEKNETSKVPHIAFISLSPSTIDPKTDTAFITFDLIDGDADIGNSSQSLIYYRDTRFDSSQFMPAEFPDIFGELEDPKKGIAGTCTFYSFIIPEVRPDSIHQKFGDTLRYEIYITDRAGNKSNHITTTNLILTP